VSNGRGWLGVVVERKADLNCKLQISNNGSVRLDWDVLVDDKYEKCSRCACSRLVAVGCNAVDRQLAGRSAPRDDRSVHAILRLVFVTVQRIYWQLSGTARELREARLPGNYERSAQVLNVLLVHKFCVRLMTTVEDFLCTHNRFEHPQYVVDNDNITLLTVNEHDAVFCETKEKGKFAGKGCHILLLERRWDVLLRL